jgi:hypothetical protein
LERYLAGRVSGPPRGGESDRDGSRDRANARGVDDQRVGKCDVWTRARGSRDPTIATGVTPSRVGIGGDRRGVVGTGGDESKRDATARRNEAVHLGE